MLLDRTKYRLGEALGYLFCEVAFKTDCRDPFQCSYRLGCWLYGIATEAGIRCGAVVENPAFGRELDEPFYIRRSH